MRDYLPPQGPMPPGPYDWASECSRYRAWKREEVLAAFVRLETAAWGRRWTDVQRARADIEALTGLQIEGPLRRELRKAVRASS